MASKAHLTTLSGMRPHFTRERGTAILCILGLDFFASVPPAKGSGVGLGTSRKRYRRQRNPPLEPIPALEASAGTFIGTSFGARTPARTPTTTPCHNHARTGYGGNGGIASDLPRGQLGKMA